MLQPNERTILIVENGKFKLMLLWTVNFSLA